MAKPSLSLVAGHEQVQLSHNPRRRITIESDNRIEASVSQVCALTPTFRVAITALLVACSPATPEVEPPASQGGTSAVDAQPSSDTGTLVVYKEATCPCCNAWVDYMRNNGFRIVAYNVSDLDAVKQKHRIAPRLQSCHTTEVGGYFVEGHVPAELVRRLLADRPRIAGIAVPGMPVGSPGMEVGPPEPYDILAVDSTGRTSIFASRGK